MFSTGHNIHRTMSWSPCTKINNLGTGQCTGSGHWTAHHLWNGMIWSLCTRSPCISQSEMWQQTVWPVMGQWVLSRWTVWLCPSEVHLNIVKHLSSLGHIHSFTALSCQRIALSGVTHTWAHLKSFHAGQRAPSNLMPLWWLMNLRITMFSVLLCSCVQISHQGSSLCLYGTTLHPPASEGGLRDDYLSLIFHLVNSYAGGLSHMSILSCYMYLHDLFTWNLWLISQFKVIFHCIW